MKNKIKKYLPDFEKLKIIYTNKLRENWTGDWNIKTNKIYIHKKLNEIDKIGVIVHEFIEMIVHAMLGIPECCSKNFNEKKHNPKNVYAHDYAEEIERDIITLASYDWFAHQKRCSDLSDKITRKKLREKNKKKNK